MLKNFRIKYRTMQALLNFKAWIKNPTSQALLGCNIVILALTILFVLVLPRTWINFLIVLSGFTSVGALVLGDYLGIKAIQAEQQLSTLFGSSDIQGAVLHIDHWIASLDRFAETPEGQEFLKKLVLLMNAAQKIVGGV
jgi:hypothetical protein